MDTDELHAREAIRETIAQYAWNADAGRFDALAELFTPDGVLEIDGEPVVTGRAAIREYLHDVGRHLGAHSMASLIRHHTSNVTIELRDATSADAQCYFLVVTEAGVDHWGRYRDRLVAHGDAWRFAHRQVRTDGVTPGGWADRRRQSA
ncbi:MAG TPA: nuclear transport factor 2 family protein [Acidimicrobiia bacterium]|nr:nuclear transport factor 2 family protein [Acidimicrobiia bacterium]